MIISIQFLKIAHKIIVLFKELKVIIIYILDSIEF